MARHRVFGECVTAEDVERLPADTGALRFVQLTGALIRKALADAGVPWATLRITERIAVPDGGVDADCELPVAAGFRETSGLVGPGHTIFQFKFRDARRRGLVAEVAARLREEVARGLPDHDRYVLLTNLDLRAPHMRKLTQAITTPAPACPPVIVIWGAAEIAGFLNNHPDLRHLFFAEGRLAVLDVVEDELKQQYRRMGWPSFVNREPELRAIGTFVSDPEARLLRVKGPRYAGKSRLVLEALKSWAPGALWAGSPQDVGVDLFRDLDSADEPTVLVVDRGDDASAPQIQEWAQQRRWLKTIIIERDSDAAQALTGDIVVRPMRPQQVARLLADVAPDLAVGLDSWILDAADGLPGLILHLALLLREGTVSSSQSPHAVRAQLEQLVVESYERHLTADERDALRMAAILPVLGFEGAVGRAADAVAKALGRDDATLLEAHRPRLERLGLLRRRGRFLEVIPTMLGDYLAAEALRRPGRIERLVVTLSPSQFLLSLDRLARLPDHQIGQAVGSLLELWCRDLPSLVTNSALVERAAPVRPEVAADAIQRVLPGVSPEELRTELTGDARRALVSTLTDLALRASTFEKAVGALLALAEAENEEVFGPHASRVFISLFSWRHPQVPISLSRRLGVLQEQARSRSVPRRRLVARSIGAALGDDAGWTIHPPRGPRPPEPTHLPATWEEVGEYAGGALSILKRLLEDSDEGVRGAARQALLDICLPIMRISSKLSPVPSKELPALTADSLATIEATAESSSDRDFRRQVIGHLELLTEEIPDDLVGVARAIRRRVEEARDRLVMGSLEARLSWWVGLPLWRTHAHKEKLLEELAALATKLVEDPDGLRESLDFLTSEDARHGAELFDILGERDRGAALLDVLLGAPSGPLWAAHFAAYMLGWAKADEMAVGRELDRLTPTRPDLADGLLRVAASLPYSASTIDRIVALLGKVSTSRSHVASLVAWRLPWARLGTADVQRLLTAIDDGTPQVRRALLPALGVRLCRGSDLSPGLRDFAWDILESTLPVSIDTGHHHEWDVVAAELGKIEAGRLLKVLETVLRSGPGGRRRLLWNHQLPLVWDVLQADAPALLAMLVRVAASPAAPRELRWALEEWIDPGRDRSALVELAREDAEYAAVIANSLNPKRPGFWDVARDLIEGAGADRVARGLRARVLSGTWKGSPLSMIDDRLGCARKLLDDPDDRVRAWAQEIVPALESWRGAAEGRDAEEWIWDYRILRAELETIVKRPDGPERLWAIERLLKDAPPTRVRELLTPEDILEALPKLDGLDARTRATWEGWARFWHGRR